VKTGLERVVLKMVRGGEQRVGKRFLTDEEFGRFLIKLLGIVMALYGFLAVISPNRYPIADLSPEWIPLAGIGMLVIGLYILRRMGVI